MVSNNIPSQVTEERRKLKRSFPIRHEKLSYPKFSVDHLEAFGLRRTANPKLEQ